MNGTAKTQRRAEPLRLEGFNKNTEGICTASDAVEHGKDDFALLAHSVIQAVMQECNGVVARETEWFINYSG